MKKFLYTFALAGSAQIALAAENVAILNNPTIQEVAQISNYKLSSSGQPFFNKVVLFAANINGKSPSRAYLFYNSYFQDLLSDKGIQTIRMLQKKGIKVDIVNT